MSSLTSMEWMGYTVILGILLLCVYIYVMPSDFELKCIVSGVDGNKYCVRERNRIQEAADLLASVVDKTRRFIDILLKKYPDDIRIIRLSKNFSSTKIVENLPTSKYTAYSENKGEKIAFCLNKTKHGDIDSLIDAHTLEFVVLHEISHIMTKSVGHKTEFWDNFKFILEEANKEGIHKPIDYSKEPVSYCDQRISDNPFFV